MKISFLSGSGRFFRHLAVLTVLPFLFFTGCAQSTSLKKIYGQDTDYFIALKALENGNQKTAERLLKNACKKGSSYVSRRAEKKLSELLPVDEKIAFLTSCHKKWNDESSLTELCRTLNAYGEYAKILDFTKKTKIEESSQELAFYRCRSLMKKNSPSFEEEFFKWSVKKEFSSWHKKLCDELLEKGIELNRTVSFRKKIYEKNYKEGAPDALFLLSDPSSLTPSVMSDIGKALLYGSSDFIKNADLLENAFNFLNDECRFYAAFYAGRLYDKSGRSKNKALDCFEKAMTVAKNKENYDNALWYFLNQELKISLPSTLQALKKYSSSWNDSAYFDDFFDTLSVNLLSNHMWKDYLNTAKMIDGKASKESSAMFSYVAGRLIETGFIEESELESKNEASALFKKATDAGTGLYYALMASSALGLDEKETENILKKLGKPSEEKTDSDFEKLLSGYADFGLPQYIYDEWKKYPDRISLECAEKLSSFLKNCSSGKDDYLAKSLRIAARKVNHPEKENSKNIMELDFPRNFYESVHSSCLEFGLEENLFYALIRSESFFDPCVSSSAKAKGLTQLMSDTASDVARKLRIKEYSLEDSSTNIRLGAFYLEEMIRRMDNSPILGLFAYNAGISRVRSWVRSAAIEFGTDSLPKDLFLESLPYAETREYGRKLLSASSMYGMLWYGKSSCQVISEIMK